MSKTTIHCPSCGHAWQIWHNPRPTVDIIIETGEGIVLIKRRNPPQGWALPGGFVDYGESLETAAIREAREETGLTVRLREQLHTYSDPRRDARGHTISTVYRAEATGGTLRAGDDAARAEIFPLTRLPELVFDHDRMVADYLERHRRQGY
ncbi:NUDIX domain-containing protein [Desulfurivibrio alkaliphilus]|uniref:NUDIX hydrolase n=1 Tax=Desulfurivibrio alkaliphilus (strain DSM 19089 / UNIQEM U267 / AHT2) TaxID=589865 RepID=D6Z3T4_DESAT|nr:NUDIX hydrolase [Desulfurivibrio alkaliphilus]ADH86209.1 NUDIX hydrolase [Desulfurivibrio alkaliphilus AHT 2]